MVNYAIIQQRIDSGLGKAASKVGAPYTALRCDENASGDFPNGWTVVAQNVPIKRNRVRDQKLDTNLLSGATLWYDLVADMSDFLLGDVFVSTDADFATGVSYGAGATILANTYEMNALALAWHPPVSKALGARLDRRGRIYRSLNRAQNENDSDETRTWLTSLDTSAPLVLNDGMYGWGALSDAGAFVPIGIGSTERPSRAPEFGPQPLPTTTPTSRYFGYLPPLPGYVPLEGDQLETEDGVRFLVTQPYFQQAGVVGSQLTIDRTLETR